MPSPALRHPVRVLTRLVWLGAELGLAAADFPIRVLWRPGGGTRVRRAAWLQLHCRRVLHVLGVKTRMEGSTPTEGLLACNHLSYVDILALGALAPMVFVAKREVRGWPVFGALARLGGTVFVHRDKPHHAATPLHEIREALDEGMLVALFPEGTSSDGSTILPFKSTLLAAVEPGRHEVHAGCIHYPPENGNVADEICYWRDMTLVPHLLNLMARSGITVWIGFTSFAEPETDRKALALQLQHEVERWRQGWAPSSNLPFAPTHPFQPQPTPRPEAS